MLKGVVLIALLCACNAYVFRRRNAPICKLDGKEYPVGEFYDGCHRCECHSDRSITCAGCPLSHGEVTCSFKGKTHKVGDFMDGKNRCTCGEDGAVGCVGTGTEPDKDCTYEGKTHKSNTIWIVDNCKMCTCENGLVGCTGKCSSDGDKDYPDEDPGCTYKGKSYMNGQMFFDGCKECACNSGAVGCNEKSCSSESNKDYPDEEPGCSYKGTSYMNGKMFFDGCKECACNSGTVSCNDNGCTRDLDHSLIELLKRRLRELV